MQPATPEKPSLDKSAIAHELDLAVLQHLRDANLSSLARQFESERGICADEAHIRELAGNGQFDAIERYLSAHAGFLQQSLATLAPRVSYALAKLSFVHALSLGRTDAAQHALLAAAVAGRIPAEKHAKFFALLRSAGPERDERLRKAQDPLFWHNAADKLVARVHEVPQLHALMAPLPKVAEGRLLAVALESLQFQRSQCILRQIPPTAATSILTDAFRSSSAATPEKQQQQQQQQQPQKSSPPPAPIAQPAAAKAPASTPPAQPQLPPTPPPPPPPPPAAAQQAPQPMDVTPTKPVQAEKPASHKRQEPAVSSPTPMDTSSSEDVQPSKRPRTEEAQPLQNSAKASAAAAAEATAAAAVSTVTAATQATPPPQPTPRPQVDVRLSHSSGNSRLLKSQDAVSAVEWHPKQAHVLLFGSLNGVAAIRDVREDENLWENKSEDHVQIIRARWSPDGSLFAAAASNGRVLVEGFPASKESPLKQLWTAGMVTDMVFAQIPGFGVALVTCTATKEIQVWSLETFKVIASLECNGLNTIRSICMGPGMQSTCVLLGVSDDAKVYKWAITGTPSGRIPGSHISLSLGPGVAVSLSSICCCGSDGNTCVVAGPRVVASIDVNTGEVIQLFGGFEESTAPTLAAIGGSGFSLCTSTNTFFFRLDHPRVIDSLALKEKVIDNFAVNCDGKLGVVIARKSHWGILVSDGTTKITVEKTANKIRHHQGSSSPRPQSTPGTAPTTAAAAAAATATTRSSPQPQPVQQQQQPLQQQPPASLATDAFDSAIVSVPDASGINFLRVSGTSERVFCACKSSKVLSFGINREGALVREEYEFSAGENNTIVAISNCDFLPQSKDEHVVACIDRARPHITKVFKALVPPLAPGSVQRQPITMLNGVGAVFSAAYSPAEKSPLAVGLENGDVFFQSVSQRATVSAHPISQLAFSLFAGQPGDFIAAVDQPANSLAVLSTSAKPGSAPEKLLPILARIDSIPDITRPTQSVALRWMATASIFLLATTRDLALFAFVVPRNELRMLGVWHAPEGKTLIAAAFSKDSETVYAATEREIFVFAAPFTAPLAPKLQINVNALFMPRMQSAAIPTIVALDASGRTRSELVLGLSNNTILRISPKGAADAKWTN